MEDNAIVELFWLRSDSAISETEKKYGTYCHMIAYNICGNNHDAEECVNDTLFRAWNLMPDKRPTSLGAFLGRITRNLALNLVKAENRIKRGSGETLLALDELSECVPSAFSVEREAEQHELQALIARFVSELSTQERHIFILRYWYLAPVREIGDVLGFSQAKVKSALFRTRNKLKKYIEEEIAW